MELQGLTSLRTLHVKNAPGVYGNHANLIAAIPVLGEPDHWGYRSNFWGDFCSPLPGAHYYQGEFACPVTTTLDAPDLLGADPCTCCDAPTFVRDTASGECVGAFLSLAGSNTLPRRKLHLPKLPLTPLPAVVAHRPDVRSGTGLQRPRDELCRRHLPHLSPHLLRRLLPDCRSSTHRRGMARLCGTTAIRPQWSARSKRGLGP